PAAYLKPVNIAANPGSFPVAVQPATIAPAAITLAAAPPPQPQQPVSQIPATVSLQQPAKDPEPEAKNDPKSSDNDVIKLLIWKDGIGELPGSDLKFKLNEFGTLEIYNEDLSNNPPAKTVRDESTTTSEENSTEGRQKTTKNKEMYQD
ncbi:hypothetical protein AVEN_257883-1, partial [Araneus ventricosus]